MFTLIVLLVAVAAAFVVVSRMGSVDAMGPITVEAVGESVEEPVAARAE